MKKQNKKRESGIPTGNAGEYFVMGELLRRGFDAQIAGRNTKGYDLLAGSEEESSLRKVQVKTVRSQPWYVKTAAFNEHPNQVTIYVLLGPKDGNGPVRFFMAKNCDVKKCIHYPVNRTTGKPWKENGFMPMKAVEPYEDRWEALRK